MGDHHNGDTIFVIELLNERIHFRRHLGVKSRNRLIKKQHFLRGAQSAGEQHPLLLARALCAAGDLLVLDEPVTGLDPAAADDLYRTLRYLNRTEGMAVVMVTHDIRSALRDAAAILHAGRDQWFLGTPGEYLASPYGKRFGGDLS